MTTREETIKVLANIVVWDPADKGTPPHKEIDSFKATHAVKKYIRHNYPSTMTRLATLGKTTDYQVLKAHPLGNLILLVFHYIDLSDLVRLTEEGKQPNGLYPYAMDKGEKMVEAMRECSAQLTAIRSGTAPVLGEELVEEEEPTVDVEALKQQLKDAHTLVAKSAASQVTTEKELAKMKDTVRDLSMKASEVSPTTVVSDGTIPDGVSVQKKITELFPDLDFNGTDFEVTTWEWDGVHPDVPVLDPHYIFRPKQVLSVLYAAATNQRCWLQGDTGAGKTTLYEQLAAVLQQPVAKISCDSHITRMDLVGKDGMLDGESFFTQGVLPTTIAKPYWLILDEFDATNTDVTYVLQSVLEGNGMMLLEDNGGTRIQPHPMSRMFAACNTVGQGDENGMYPAVRPQSMAVLDRFEIWDKVPYLTSDERARLLDRHCPLLSTKANKIVRDYVTEHMEAFDKQKIIQPISPRGMIALGKAMIIFEDPKQVLSMVVLDKANQEDYAVLKGIVDRVVA